MKFLPLLFLYIVVIVVMSTDIFTGDEGRYVMFADNLTHGYYSPKDDVNLWNGPGYPILLAPFVLLKLPWLAAKLLNAIFMFTAIIYFYKTLKLYIENESRLVLLCYLLGLYPPLFLYLPTLHTEILSVFLICGFLFHFCKLYHDNKNAKKHLFIASIYLAYLALTKIFFGYVILAGILLFLFLYFWKRKDIYKKTVSVYLLALLLCSPYLLYTYSLTKRIFYWGDSGGSSLYWMATPYKDEFGDWIDAKRVMENSQFEKHKELFNKLKVLPRIRRDDELKRQAINNITQHPVKYLMNISANIGRMLFNYPYSYTPQKMDTYFYVVSNIFILTFSILCIYPYFARRKIIPEEMHIIIVSFLISFAGSSLVSAYPRQFMILIPFLLFWIIFILTKVVKVQLQD